MSARVRRIGVAGVVTLLAIGVALLARPPASWSATSIVAVPTSSHGWKRVTVSPRAARADLDGRLSPRSARRLRLAAIQATGADLRGVEGGARLRDEPLSCIRLAGPAPSSARGPAAMLGALRSAMTAASSPCAGGRASSGARGRASG